MIKLRISQRYVDDFLILLLYCISGNPAFTHTQALGKVIFGLALVIILIVSRFKIKKTALKQAALWLLLLGVIFFAQFLQFRFITVPGSLNFAVKMLCAIFLASYLGDRFPTAAIRVMSIICLISLVFFLINLTGVRFQSPIKISTKGESLIVYTQTWMDPVKREIFRNSGMFWEPGAFAGYIVATLLLFVDNIEALWRNHLRQFIILSIALLTTFSTTGYITFFLLILLFLLKWGTNNKKRFISYVLVAVIALSGVFAYIRLDFLGEKIQHQFRDAEQMTENDISDSRFGSIVVDLPYIVSHPVFGNGLAQSTRLRFHLGVFDEEDLDGLGNGFSGCIASMGGLFMIAFLLAIGFNRSLKAQWLVIIMVIALLQGEYFLNYPFFMMFPFIHFNMDLKQRIIRGRRIKFSWNKRAPVALPS